MSDGGRRPSYLIRRRSMKSSDTRSGTPPRVKTFVLRRSANVHLVSKTEIAAMWKKKSADFGMVAQTMIADHMQQSLIAAMKRGLVR